MNILMAKEGKVWAYMDGETEMILGPVLYLGVNDDGSRYYEIDLPQEEEIEHDII